MMRKILCCFFALGFIFNMEARLSEVEIWDRYEYAHKAKVTGNPFELSFSATFTHADTSLTVKGFYAGDNVFKLRFMPIKTGKWTFVSQSSEAKLNGLTGSFECIEAGENNHGPVQVANTFHFKYADGTRYYPIGTTSYDWMHIEGDYPEKTVRALEASGFNKIRMLLFVHNFDKDYPEPLLFPFEIKRQSKKADGSIAYEWDFERFNPAYFDMIEARIDALKAIGVEADLILFHPYDEGRWGFDRMPLEVSLRYLEYALARLSSFRNIWWSLANEFDYLRLQAPENWMIFTRQVVANDPYRHLCSIHGSTARYFDYWRDEFTHVSVQDQAPVEGHGRAATVRNIYQKPVIFDEVCYEGNMDNRWGSLSGEEMLYRMWQGIIAGTYVSHSECYMDAPNDYTHDFLARGGDFQGESWKRIRFMRNILEDMPNPLQLSDSSWDPYVSIAGPNYLMIYRGKEVAKEWVFNLPARNPSYPRIKEGTRFKVEIIDTWNMTIEECPIIFEAKNQRYRVCDKENRAVALPERPYLLLRITEVAL